MSGRLILALAVLLCFVSCRSGPESAPAIGAAFVGPMTLNLRQELTPRAPVTATVQHGDRLEILEWRRRFARVRTGQGAEGWTDGRLLFSPEQMERLRQAGERASRMPAQGRATVNDPLNVHTHPNRQSPSFYQIAEGGSVEVIQHRLAPRTEFQSLSEGQTKRAPPPPRKKRGKSAAPAQPTPPLPPRAVEKPPEKIAAPAPVDDWTLVRLPNGKAGWVLTRLLVMAIPDEVAQYAEGHRITSYFSLGEVQDKDLSKNHWLWTTLSSGLKPYQFDGFRVFVWSTRRHRYETAYIERNLKGYFPVEVHPPTAASPMPSFSLVIENKDGSLTRRTYAFQGYRVRVIARQPFQLPPEVSDAPERPLEPAPDAPAQSPGAWVRLKAGIGSIFGSRRD